MQNKICNICNIEKDLNEFRNRKDSKDGKRNDCKSCQSNRNKLYYENNKNTINKKRKIFYQENRERLLDIRKKYCDDNKEVIKDKRKIYNKFKKENDPLFRFRKNIGIMVRQSLTRNKYTKKSKSFSIIGCNFEEFRLYIESKFEPWMTWDNYGNPKDGILEPNKTWDIDHIIPLSTAKSEDDVIRLNHHTNLQPLCSYINRKIKRDQI